MGAAKQRGPFETRQAQAYEKIDAAHIGMAEHIKKLEELEEESKQRLAVVATKMVTAFLASQDRQRKARMGIRIGGNGTAS